MDERSIRAEIRTYMGKELFNVVDNMSPKEFDELINLVNVEDKKSYVVKGSKESLKKFEALYLFQCAYKKPFFGRYLLTDYITSLFSNDEDDEFLEKEIMILYSHGESFGIGNAETLFLTTILEKIATRARRGGVTIILTERTLPLIEKSEEVIVLQLDDKVKNVKPFIPAPKSTYVSGSPRYSSTNKYSHSKKRNEDYISEEGWSRSKDTYNEEDLDDTFKDNEMYKEYADKIIAKKEEEE